MGSDNAPMLWSDNVLREIADKLQQLGLQRCPVCDSETSLQTDKRPVILPVGGTPWRTDTALDQDANILFMFRVECDLCGYSLLFNGERFVAGDSAAFG